MFARALAAAAVLGALLCAAPAQAAVSVFQRPLTPGPALVSGTFQSEVLSVSTNAVSVRLTADFVAGVPARVRLAAIACAGPRGRQCNNAQRQRQYMVDAGAHHIVWQTTVQAPADVHGLTTTLTDPQSATPAAFITHAL